MKIIGLEDAKFPIKIEMDYDFDIRAESDDRDLILPQTLPEIENFFKLMGLSNVKALPYCNAPRAAACSTLMIELADFRDAVLLAAHLTYGTVLDTIRFIRDSEEPFAVDFNTVDGKMTSMVSFFYE